MAHLEDFLAFLVGLFDGFSGAADSRFLFPRILDSFWSMIVSTLAASLSTISSIGTSSVAELDSDDDSESVSDELEDSELSCLALRLFEGG